MNSIEQIQAAYRRMAEGARYRPAAPSDGFGNITVPFEDLNLDEEAAKYAARWMTEEDEGVFRLGCCDFSTRAAAIFAGGLSASLPRFRWSLAMPPVRR